MTAPAHFFARELRPETPVSLETARRLCSSAKRFFSRQPWQLLEETQLVLVAGDSKEACACSVMGILGQVFALVAYRGARGYDFFRKLASAASISAGEFLAEQSSVSVQFVPRRELTASDRTLLKAAGPDWARSPLVPQFRTARPGYHPWYPNQEEAEILAECLRAMNWLLENPPFNVADLWSEDGLYPQLSRAAGPDVEGYRIRLAEPPRAPVTMPALPALDTARIAGLVARRQKPKGALEIDQFLCAARIGARHERKSCIRVALVIDSETAHAYAPEAVSPETAPGELLASVLLSALEQGAPLPAALHVRDAETRRLLDPLARALGTKVQVKRSLPVLDFAKRNLLDMMGDPGTLSLNPENEFF